MAVFSEGSPLAFFDRIAHELPPLLERDALVWVGVIWSNVVGARELFEAAGWEIVDAHPAAEDTTKPSPSQVWTLRGPPAAHRKVETRRDEL